LLLDGPEPSALRIVAQSSRASAYCPSLGGKEGRREEGREGGRELQRRCEPTILTFKMDI